MNRELGDKDVAKDKNSQKYKMHMALGLMFLTVFIDLIGFGIIIPLLPLYAKQFGASGLEVGFLLMSYSLMQFFFAPMWGRLSDRIGRRPVLMISLATSAVGYTIWGLSTSLAMLFVSRIVAGFGNANLAVAQAYIADVTPAENRAQGMGIIGAAFGLGFVLGPAIAGIICQFGVHPNMLGFIAAFFSIADLIFTGLMLPESNGVTVFDTIPFRSVPTFISVRLLTISSRCLCSLSSSPRLLLPTWKRLWYC